MQLPSSLLENAVAQFTRLPGIGKKTALRLVLHLLKQDVNEVQHFGETIARMRGISNSASVATISAMAISVPSAPIPCATSV
jgi:recombinational DNA repair protein RecR